MSDRADARGESGVYGFLSHLDSRPSAQLLLQSITAEARQRLIFRQFSGAFPRPVYFETGISQSMAWTLLSPYIVSCPPENPHIEWQNFPWLNVVNDQPPRRRLSRRHFAQSHIAHRARA
jgi:hypothetical protein